MEGRPAVKARGEAQRRKVEASQPALSTRQWVALEVAEMGSDDPQEALAIGQ